MLAFSVTGFEQICARWRAVVANYNKSTDCANMTEAVRLKCSTGVGYGYRKCECVGRKITVQIAFQKA